MTQGIDVTVAAIVEREQRFLVVEERVAGHVVLNQPAGHLEPGESLLAAVGARDTRGDGLSLRAGRRRRHLFVAQR